MLPLTVTIRSVDGESVSLSTATGHVFELPATATPGTPGPDGRLPLDLAAMASVAMPDHVRHRMAYALLNELMTC